MVDLFEETRRAAICLTRVPSVSPDPSELAAAQEVVRLLCAGNGRFDATGIEPVPSDPHGRGNAYAVLRGRSARTIVLFGHIDTVGVEDYGELQPFAFDPEALAARMAVPDGWLPGRGIADMKSGVAATVVVARHLASLPPQNRPLSIVLLATPDEEYQSRGILAAVDLLLRLREQFGLEYVGAINTEYTAAHFPGDPHRYVYLGSTGKLLPCVYVVGRPAHAGAPFDGLDANALTAELICELDLNPDLADAADGHRASPPVVLHASDLKAAYNTQIPHDASFYLNQLTLTLCPGQVLDALAGRAEAALGRALQRLARREEQWSGRPVAMERGRVIRYRELHAAAVNRVGVDAVQTAVDGTPGVDERERSARIVRRLWALSGLQPPAAVLYFSPPYYPHVPPTAGPLARALAEVVEAHPELNLRCEPYFPLLSDMSYLRLDPDLDLSDLTANMPLWGDGPARYTLPLDSIRALDLPAVNIGPYGYGVHTPHERVHMDYAFRTVPQLILQTIERLAALLAQP